MIKLLRTVKELWARGIWMLKCQKKIYARVLQKVALASAMLIKIFIFQYWKLLVETTVVLVVPKRR
jgi:hypothetical protein